MKKKLLFGILFLMILALAGCGSPKSSIKDYIQSTLDASYQGEFKAYLKNTDATQAGAEELYASMKSYVADSLTILAMVDSDSVTAEQQKTLDEMAAQILAKTKYQVGEVRELSSEQYEVDVTVNPIGLWAQIEQDLAPAMEEYNAALEKDEEPDAAQMSLMEQAYTDRVLEIARTCLDQMVYEEEKVVTLPVTVKEKTRSVKDDDWEALDDVVLNIDYILDLFGVEE